MFKFGIFFLCTFKLRKIRINVYPEMFIDYYYCQKLHRAQIILQLITVFILITLHVSTNQKVGICSANNYHFFLLHVD